MSDTLRRVVELVQGGEIQISAHGYDEMAEDGILAREVLGGLGTATVVEDYPTIRRGRVRLFCERIRMATRCT